MHVTLYHDCNIPIPPPRYGGTERVIHWLGKALIQLGHRVTLLARPGSVIPGAELRPLTKKHAHGHGWRQLIPTSCDLLHLWRPPDAPLPKPYLVTMGSNGRPGIQFPPTTLFVSREHAANHGSRHFVYNGIDPAEYACSAVRDEYAVFLAVARQRAKNLVGAIEVARAAGIPLHVLGSRHWARPFHWIFPTCGVRFHGMVGGQKKRELLSRARCLIFPVRYPEPFGVAITEALASGCYVVGTPYGSLPEIVTPGVGVLSTDAHDLVAAICTPYPFVPATCRTRVVEGGFTHLDMARSYLRYYERVLTRGRLGDADEAPPRTDPGFEYRNLLPWNEEREGNHRGDRE
jgi:glycosyltransferase involved in cell wall biosynthesis